MRRTSAIRICAWLLTVSITMSFAGCGDNSTPIPSEDEIPTSSQELTTTTDETSDLVEEQDSADQESTISSEQPVEPTIMPAEESTDPERDENGLTEQQRNSFSMLYYLAITAEDIRISKDNRLILNDIYTSLLNDINPGAIDETTQDHLENLRDIIKSYINISAKRDRLQYIYNQDKAASIRSAVPDPLAILSMTNSFNWKKLATSAVYTVVDSYNNYKSANESADQAFLMSGWELDDEETATIQKNRERAFNYMVDIVREYALDGKLTLNEKAIETFSEICGIESIQQKIRRLESEEETYKLLGNYWLELADCYYQTAQYEKCLKCVEQYNKLAIGIYRKDYNYVQILPKAIVAAQETYTGVEYVSHIKAFTDSIMENTTTEEWSIRYFAAQSYLDLYARTNDRKYLENAYNIAYDNVAILVDEQRALNTTYLNEVQEVTVSEPDYRFMSEKEKKKAKEEYKAEQKRLKAYNNALKEARKTELPPLFEPFILNCDLLFALADKMGISFAEKSEIEAILQTDKNGVFLSRPINDRYVFTTEKSEYSIEFGKNEIVIPADLLTEGAEVIVSVSDGGKSTTFDDCSVKKVVREGDTIDSFKVTISSKLMQDYKWTKNSKVTVKIINSEKNNPLVFKFKVLEYKDKWLIADKVVFGKE